MSKPILFIDLDRTMFDAAKLCEFWGIEPEKRLPFMQATVRGDIPEPEWAQLVYPDVKPFLEKARERYTLVLVTRTIDIAFQKQKFARSGLVKYFHGALYTTAFDAKGELVRDYLAKRSERPSHAYFIDDEPLHVSSVKRKNPEVGTFLIVRPNYLPRNSHPEMTPPDRVVEDFADVAHHLHLYR